MANLTLSVPDALVPKIGAACRDALGKDGVGLSDAAAAKLVIKRHMERVYRVYSIKTGVGPLVASAQAASDAARASEAAERAAAKSAEATVEAQVKTEFAGVS